MAMRAEATAHRFTLDNGLRVIVDPDRRHELVSIALTVGAGSRADPPGARGMAHLVEHLMFPRDGEHGRRGYLRNVEGSGGICDGVTHRDHTSYYGIVGARHLEYMLGWEADRLTGFAARQAMLDSELAIVEEEIRAAGVASHGGYPWTAAASALFGQARHAGGEHVSPSISATSPPPARRHFTGIGTPPTTWCSPSSATSTPPE